ncbi:MAG: hypothetical protein US51_C0029G0001, partial [Microgenomates group bacterium GW2011_GWA2_37_6]
RRGQRQAHQVHRPVEQQRRHGRGADGLFVHQRVGSDGAAGEQNCGYGQN